MDFEYFINHFMLRAFCAISRYQIFNKRVNISSEIQRFQPACPITTFNEIPTTSVHNTDDEKEGKFCLLEYFERSETLRISSRVTALATYFSPSLNLRVTRYRDTVSRVYTLPRVLRLFARLHVLTLNLRCCNTVSVYNDSQSRQLKTVVVIKITSY